MKLTQKQQEAVDTQSKKVLISAAAGSGKTSVLAKRVARLVRDGVDIRNILVMTFTNAAAAEMKQRISREILTHAAESKRLQEQAEYVGLADISTFHSFCGKVIRQNYELLGISPNFRIAAENESKMLKNNAIREMFDLLYEQQDEDFLRLMKRYTKRGNDAQLAQQIIRIYNYMMSKPRPFEWVQKTLERDLSAYISNLKIEYEKMLFEYLENAERLFLLAQEYSENYDMEQEKRDGEAVQLVQQMIACAKKDGFGIMIERFYGISIPRMKSKLAEEHKEVIEPLRAAGKAILKKVQEEKNFSDFEKNAEIQLAHTKKDVKAFIKFVRIFKNRYSVKKSDANTLDYEDLQHFTLRVFEDKTCREQYAKKYEHIFVDEYQDTNPVQEEIIKALEDENCLFMVGDIKQSIYKFRLADPMIFKQKALEFHEGKDADKQVITMNDNFRSMGGVIDAVNGVMGHVMSEQLGEIVYDDSEKLLQNIEGGKTEILLCERYDAEDEESQDKYEAQANMIANSIEQVLQDEVLDKDTKCLRSVAYADIAVLMRSRSGMTSALKNEFDRRNIPCVIDIEQSKDIIEIELFVNVLKLVDNFDQDIALLSVMRSFIGGFDENDFVKIRLCAHDKDAAFYEAMKQYERLADEELKQRIKKFIAKIADLKERERAFALGDFVLYAAQVFHFETYIACSTGGEFKQNAFYQFLDMTVGLITQNSLYLLLKELADIKKREGCYVRTNAGASDSNCIRVMTIHGSKGLEFPIVYIAGMDAKFNLRDLNDDILIHSDFGLMPKYTDEDQFLSKNTVERTIAQRLLTAEYQSEELRVLYVAMTRARNRLFLTGCVRNFEKQRVKWAAMFITQDYGSATCMLDWVMSAHDEIEVRYTCEQSGGVQAKNIDVNAYMRGIPAPSKELLCLKKQSIVPAKVSVSAVKKSRGKYAKSFFMADVQNDDEITGARLGTLIHSMMERVIFRNESVKKIAEEMLEHEILSQKEYEAITKNEKMIGDFLNTEIYVRIKSAKRVLREQPFNLRAAASDLGFFGNEAMLVQGILDLAFLEEGQWVLLDYKTDRVTAQTVKEAAEGYKIQLDLYARALADITGIPVKQKYLYFLRLGKTVEV
ncbi:MAG: UvrD-helicase domain-containing protein [Christensenellaceae bacterium]